MLRRRHQSLLISLARLIIAGSVCRFVVALPGYNHFFSALFTLRLVNHGTEPPETRPRPRPRARVRQRTAFWRKTTKWTCLLDVIWKTANYTLEGSRAS
jgi:hypothetical protein